MVDVARTFTVRTPFETVVGYLGDWGNSREWDPGTVTCERIGDGPVEVGSEWRNVLRLLRRDVVVVFRLEHAANGLLVFSGRNPGATSTDTIACHARDDGRTSIVYHSRVVFHGPARLAAPLLTWQFERIGDRLVTRITTALEGRA